MAYNEQLGQRIAQILMDDAVEFSEKKMFGGLDFMLNDKMCFGVVKDELMLRVLDSRYDEVLSMHHARPMEFTGRPMTGFVFIENEGFATDGQLKRWLDMGLEFAEKGIVKSKKKK